MNNKCKLSKRKGIIKIRTERNETEGRIIGEEEELLSLSLIF